MLRARGTRYAVRGEESQSPKKSIRISRPRTSNVSLAVAEHSTRRNGAERDPGDDQHSGADILERFTITVSGALRRNTATATHSLNKGTSHGYGYVCGLQGFSR